MKKIKTTRNGHLDQRGQSPASRANLRPAQPGEVHNPTGTNQYTGPHRPFTAAIEALAHEPIPEALRCYLNARTRQDFFLYLRASVRKALKLCIGDLPDLFEKGVTWAQANAMRQSLSAVVDGNIGAAIELREAVEGRAPTRVEFVSQNDKLEELLSQFRRASDLAEKEDGPIPEKPPKVH